MWFKRIKESKAQKKVKIPEGLWIKCDGCKEIVYKKEIEKNLQVCPKCNYHFRISAKERIQLVADEGSFTEINLDIFTGDPLNFKDLVSSYKNRVEENRKKSELQEAVVIGEAVIDGHPAVVAVMDFSFMGGSMGSVVGEKIARAAETALEKKIAFISIASSGGARMQEGIFSLMQMAKVSAVVGKLKDNGVLFISVLADPTFGGVAASFAMLGDVIIAEPKSLIGFAGARVIEQTIKQQLPENFQRAEFLLEHGLIDMVVPREEIKATLAKIIRLLS